MHGGLHCGESAEQSVVGREGVIEPLLLERSVPYLLTYAGLLCGRWCTGELGGDSEGARTEEIKRGAGQGHVANRQT